MEVINRPSQISFETLYALLPSYDSHVPVKVQELEELRLATIPKSLSQRKEDREPFLEKTEATSLVEWKLKHGTYRPNLANLVASNSSKDVRDITRSAFEIYEADNNDYAKAITVLSKLKGVGPATSSLLLSCYDPVDVPFFSDEMYRYLHWKEAKSMGWDRKVSYTIKEYKSLFGKVQELRERLKEESGKEVSAIDIEKAAYVLGKDALRSSTELPSATKEDEDTGADNALQPPPPKRRKKGSRI